jgi:hypothetical protein
MGRAEELFTRIKSGGAAEVHEMISAQVVEELFLDYKRSSTHLPARKLSDDDRKNLAKAVGGFANSEGGVILWGVDCRPTQDGDVPTEPVPITNPLALKTLFDSALGGLTLPPHPGVENVVIWNPSNNDGFVLTYVPPGLHVPYQSLYPKPSEYYIRAGSNFLPTPHGVLAGLFGRAPQPNVAPVVSLNIVTALAHKCMLLQLDVGVINRGRGFAEDIFCIVEPTSGDASAVQYPYEKYDGRQGWRVRNNGSDRFTFVYGKMVLPPSTEQKAFSMRFEIIEKFRCDNHSFTVYCGCRGGPGAAQTITLPGELIEKVFYYYTDNSALKFDVRPELKDIDPQKLFVECLRAQTAS